jgi:hypothetical protein
MKRRAAVLTIAMTLALSFGASGQAYAFHHSKLPSTTCAADAAGSPSNDNGQAKEAIVAHNPAQTLPLPPVGTPAQTALAAAPAHEDCANAE